MRGNHLYSNTRSDVICALVTRVGGGGGWLPPYTTLASGAIPTLSGGSKMERRSILLYPPLPVFAVGIWSGACLPGIPGCKCAAGSRLGPVGGRLWCR